MAPERLPLSDLQKWVRPKPREPAAEQLAEGSGSGTRNSLVAAAASGARPPCPAVPMHDALEDQLPVDSALDRVEQGRHLE